MARILNSPNQNVAGEQLVLLQTAITEIKRLIISGANQKQIQTVINNYCSKFTNEQTQAVFRRNLIQSTNKMLYEYNHNMKVINQSFINQVIKAFAIGTGTSLSNNAYTIDLTAIYREYLNEEIDQRKVITEFRNHITNAKKGLALIKDYDRKVIEQTKLLASEPVKYIAKDGRAISLRNKAEMNVRYEANMKDLEQYKSLGIKLVWTSSHADASPRCSPFQGKLWSLDGTSGTIDGIKYQPIEIALNANGGNSIINGYNCRHYLIEYEKGSVAPRHFTSKEIQKEYRIDQRQRMYENEIRHKKTMETLLRQQGFKEEASKMRKQWQNLNKRYEEYSIKNGRAFYRWRTKISQEEREKIIEVRNLNVLQKQVDQMEKGTQFDEKLAKDFENEFAKIEHTYVSYNFKKEALEEIDVYKKYQKGLANENNFFINTIAKFTSVERPKKEPSYISYNRYGEISSMYWYTEEGVIRGSNHWGSGVASCDWYLDEDITKLKVTDKNQYGFCKWNEFMERTKVAELDIGRESFKFLTTLENVIGKDEETKNILIKNGDYIISMDRDGFCSTELYTDYIANKSNEADKKELSRRNMILKQTKERLSKATTEEEKEEIWLQYEFNLEIEKNQQLALEKIKPYLDDFESLNKFIKNIGLDISQYENKYTKKISEKYYFETGFWTFVAKDEKDFVKKMRKEIEGKTFALIRLAEYLYKTKQM